MTAGEAGIVAAAAAAAAAAADSGGGGDDDDGGGGDDNDGDDGDGDCAGCADLLSWTRPPATQHTLRPEAARHHGRCW